MGLADEEEAPLAAPAAALDDADEMVDVYGVTWPFAPVEDPIATTS